jgi:hypothetical protein
MFHPVPNRQKPDPLGDPSQTMYYYSSIYTTDPKQRECSNSRRMQEGHQLRKSSRD